MSDDMPENLLRLDDFLCSDAVDDDAMLLGELDGFLAGVIVCPDLIPPSQWMPCIWGEDGPEFDSEHQAQTIIGIIMDHYNGIIGQLDRGEYRPIYDVDIDDSIFWEIWMEGFCRAMSLRPDAWGVFDDAQDKDLQRALFIIGRLGELATLSGNEVDPMEIDEELEELAPDLIPSYVETLHRARLAQANPFPKPTNENHAKVGRNDPCPCGSGKKFKKCCLN